MESWEKRTPLDVHLSKHWENAEVLGVDRSGGRGYVLFILSVLFPLGTFVSLGFENSADTGFAGLVIHRTRGEMRWAQRFGYGRATTLLYGVSAPPGFWAFLISGD